MWGDSKARATSKKKKKKEKLLSIQKEMSSGSTTMDPDLSAAVQGNCLIRKLCKKMINVNILKQAENYTGIIFFRLSDIGDRLIEVVGLENCLHMGQVRTGLRSSGKRLAQCSSLIIKTKKKFPMQVDGEPWCQVPCTVCLI